MSKRIIGRVVVVVVVLILVGVGLFRLFPRDRVPTKSERTLIKTQVRLVGVEIVGEIKAQDSSMADVVARIRAVSKEQPVAGWTLRYLCNPDVSLWRSPEAGEAVLLIAEVRGPGTESVFRFQFSQGFSTVQSASAVDTQEWLALDHD